MMLFKIVSYTSEENKNLAGSKCDACQILDDLVPISRPSKITFLGKGGIFYRGCSIFNKKTLGTNGKR